MKVALVLIKPALRFVATLQNSCTATPRIAKTGADILDSSLFIAYQWNLARFRHNQLPQKY